MKMLKTRARPVGGTQLKGTWIRLQRLRLISSMYLKKIPKSGKITQKDSLERFKQNNKDESREPEFLYKAQYKVHLYKRKAPGHYIA
jgi:hypothetical protein